MPVIVISGKPGCGSSTVAKLLAEKLHLDHFSVGDYNKSHSKARDEADRSIEVWKGVGAKKKFHVDSDKLARQKSDKGHVVIDGKLAVRMLKGHYDYSVWLTAPKGTRIKRYAQRDKLDPAEAAKKLAEKEKLERDNWKRIYGFDYFVQEKEAELVIDTGDKTPDEIIDLIISRIRRVFIVHRWTGTPEADWYPDTKKQLEKKGFLVDVLAMPNTRKPQLAEWLPFLAAAIGKPGKNTFLVGHSAGVATILHYLARLKNERVGGCVLVAGWIDSVGYKQLSNFVEQPYDYDRIKRHCKKFTVIDSDDDPYVSLYHGQAFQKQLGAKRITEHKKGHLDDDSKIKRLPSVVKAVEDMAK